MSIPFDQVSYLFLCIQHAGGKIDFSGVAQDYQRIHGQELSKGAAEKRFARLKVKMEDMGMAGTGTNKTPSPRKRKSDDGSQQTEDKKVKKEVKEAATSNE